MRLFHFNMVKMPSFYPVFRLGCQRHFIGCPFGTSRKKHQPFPVAYRIFYSTRFIYYLILLVAAFCRDELLSRSLPTRRKSWEREGFGEGKGNLSPERFPFPSPSFPLRALHNGVKRGDGKGAAATPPFKDDLGNVTLGEKFL